MYKQLLANRELQNTKQNR